MAQLTTLNPASMRLVMESVPFLKQHGEKITTVFYQKLFSNHPELLNLFNQTHQKQKQQQKALAEMVMSAAMHLQNLEAIAPAITRIAHKHRSLDVKPEQYPIVGENLLAAIKEVLGEKATPEILNAWAEVYSFLADQFIRIETQLAEELLQQPGGWTGFREFVIDKKEKESDVITSFYLVPKDGKAICSFQPGQYISVKMDIPGEKITHIRQYSLSDSPSKPYYRISVKREDGNDQFPAGIVSTFLHNRILEGDSLMISAPAGDFVLQEKENRPVVLISGGVGLTPLVSMLNTLAERRHDVPVTFIHAALNSRVHAMKDHLRNLAEQHDNIRYFVCYEQPSDEDRRLKNFDKEGYLDLDWLRSLIPSPEADFYFCGPVPFMKVVKSLLGQLGVKDTDMHYEIFGSAIPI
ncbi:MULTISPECIES: NO-inducible flavohemoprotein [unclassified Thermoactinomyces]|uniref:NO-inducible flavohemoprotein n=1 Tax=unclassified Thermoactinomyces TaxID=2634588 RepID=UPI0018DB6CA1|nr:MULTISPECIES: NO-inducible flavohemoprotein [unclassified Thermoactinomyces]MBH8602894.1 NO-inducible flavohemoprotein [Thermoactinomyces sp. CICC 10522]MBH8607258.1 NO-inducible flavohemoprotein [Thermoactinomyces sp. CICC 10521]